MRVKVRRVIVLGRYASAEAKAGRMFGPNPHSESGQTRRDRPTGVGVSTRLRLTGDQAGLCHRGQLEACAPRLEVARDAASLERPRAAERRPRGGRSCQHASARPGMYLSRIFSSGLLTVRVLAAPAERPGGSAASRYLARGQRLVGGGMDKYHIAV